MSKNPECFGCFPHEVPPMMQDCYKNCRGSIILCKQATHKKETKNSDNQTIYEICLKDDRLRCTCDEVVREESFFQAQGHYHHCMLYQVTRAIELSLKFLRNKETEKAKE